MQILMPQLGETVAEGKITAWFKSVGDPVASGENLFEIETDKVSMEVPAVSAGVLSEIRVKQGEIAAVGAIVAVIADRDGDSGVSKKKPKAEPAVKPDPYQAVRTPERNFGPAKLANGIVATPLARRLASERGIDLLEVRGSGPGGRITAADIQVAEATSPAQTARNEAPEQIRALYRGVPFEEVPLDSMRRIISKRLVEAIRTIPHFYVSSSVDVERLLALREEANASATLKLSITDFLIKALALALQRVPAANVVWAEDRILRFKHSDIGVAVAIEDGLLTPVIRQAEAKPLSAISAEMRDLAARARQRKLKPEEYQGGAATISNLGMYGVHAFSAIINPPHATMLAVGAGVRQPVEDGKGGIRFTTQMTVTLSCDHRVVDGALGAQLLAAFKAIVENPIAMLI